MANYVRQLSAHLDLINETPVSLRGALTAHLTRALTLRRGRRAPPARWMQREIDAFMDEQDLEPESFDPWGIVIRNRRLIEAIARTKAPQVGVSADAYSSDLSLYCAERADRFDPSKYNGAASGNRKLLNAERNWIRWQARAVHKRHIRANTGASFVDDDGMTLDNLSSTHDVEATVLLRELYADSAPDEQDAIEALAMGLTPREQRSSGIDPAFAGEVRTLLEDACTLS